MIQHNIVTNSLQLATLTEIISNWGGKFVRTGGVKIYRQRYPRLRSVVIDYGTHLSIWSIFTNGNATITHIDYRDKDGKLTGWVDLEKDMSELEGRTIIE